MRIVRWGTSSSLLFLALFQFAWNACAADGDGLPESVSKFCNEALNRDRGVASTALAGNVDQAFLNMMLSDRAMKTRVGLSDKDVQRLRESGLKAKSDTPPISKSAKASILEEMDNLGVDARQRIDKVLNTTQKERLSLLYLRAEGAMALRRPALATKVGLTSEQVARIRSLSDDAIEKALPLQQGGLSAMKGARKDAIKKQLRQKSKELDLAIVRLLKEEQLAELKLLVEQPVK